MIWFVKKKDNIFNEITRMRLRILLHLEKSFRRFKFVVEVVTGAVVGKRGIFSRLQLRSTITDVGRCGIIPEDPARWIQPGNRCNFRKRSHAKHFKMKKKIICNENPRNPSSGAANSVLHELKYFTLVARTAPNNKHD